MHDHSHTFFTIEVEQELFPLCPFVKSTLRMILTLHWQTFTDFALFLFQDEYQFELCMLGKQAVLFFFSWRFIRRTFHGSQCVVMSVFSVMRSCRVSLELMKHLSLDLQKHRFFEGTLRTLVQAKVKRIYLWKAASHKALICSETLGSKRQVRHCTSAQLQRPNMFNESFWRFDIANPKN